MAGVLLRAFTIACAAVLVVADVVVYDEVSRDEHLLTANLRTPAQNLRTCLTAVV